jgi:NADPH:quinone reductase-like Zn-dependent oxidoreductase
MKAIRAHQETGIDGLTLEEVPEPELHTCEVLVKVAACGITHNELEWPVWTCRAGHPRKTVTPGQEVSGVVAALGFGTTGFAVGDEVYGLTDQLRDGAAAEYVVVEARNLAAKPSSLDHVQTAALPRAGLTAWQALFTHGHLGKDQTVVVHGAGGAVGSMAVQLARWAGATVIGTGREHSRRLVQELGAEEFIALDHEPLDGLGSRADLVVDTVGGEVLTGSAGLLRRGGTLVTIKPDAQLPTDSEITVVVFIQEALRDQLIQLASLADAGAIRPQVGATYPLAEAREAFTAKAAGGLNGRVILTP